MLKLEWCYQLKLALLLIFYFIKWWISLKSFKILPHICCLGFSFFFFKGVEMGKELRMKSLGCFLSYSWYMLTKVSIQGPLRSLILTYRFNALRSCSEGKDVLVCFKLYFMDSLWIISHHLVDISFLFRIFFFFPGLGVFGVCGPGIGIKGAKSIMRS